MIRLSSEALPVSASQRLAALQSDLDAIADYADRVAAAKVQFSRQNRPHNPTFRVVRKTLGLMCSGAVRCCYCEDSAADEVEHFRPKDLYPEATFIWENYLYACGPCNGPKNNQFAVFPDAGGPSVNVTRKHRDPILPPIAGAPLLINPRGEDPLEFFELDLQDTFWFQPALRLGPRGIERAVYTIDVLRLNARDVLPTARREAYDSYRARLSEYRTEKARGSPGVARLVESLGRMGHPTVWREMQRQHRALRTGDPELYELFEECPEALAW